VDLLWRGDRILEQLQLRTALPPPGAAAARVRVRGPVGVAAVVGTQWDLPGSALRVIALVEAAADLLATTTNMSRHFRHKQDLAADASNALSNMKEKARKHGTQMLKSNIGGSMALEFDPGVETALGNYNSGSWARTFCTLKPRVMPVIPIAFIMTIAVSWSFLFKVLEYAFNVDAMVLQSNLGIPATALSILGSTIGFVLCVRLNNANGQWWEGRGHFGKAVSNSVDVTGIFCASCTANTNGAVQRFVGTHCLAFVVTLKNLLRTDEQDDSDDAAELRQFMAPNDYEFVMSANSEYRPMLVLQLLRTVISKLAAEEKLPQLTAQTLLSALSDMNDAYYSCLKVH
jgi:predicted membrane chloride channel (bestrophin family)